MTNPGEGTVADFQRKTLFKTPSQALCGTVVHPYPLMRQRELIRRARKLGVNISESDLPPVRRDEAELLKHLEDIQRQSDMRKEIEAVRKAQKLEVEFSESTLPNLRERARRLGVQFEDD